MTKVFPTRWSYDPPPLQKTTFPVEFPDKICTIDRVRQTMISAKTKLKKQNEKVEVAQISESAFDIHDHQAVN